MVEKSAFAWLDATLPEKRGALGACEVDEVEAGQLERRRRLVAGVGRLSVLLRAALDLLLDDNSEDGVRAGGDRVELRGLGGA